MFSIGDAVIHPVLGAGFVTGRKKKQLLDKNLEYFEIEILGKNETKVMVPVENAVSLGLRHAISDDELNKVWQVLSSTAEELPDDNKKRKLVLNRRFETQETCQIAKLVRDLEWRKAQGKNINTTGRKLYDKAMDFLVREIAVAQDVQMRFAKVKVQEALANGLRSNVNLS
jgi:CarD family transcriptional regulator